MGVAAALVGYECRVNIPGVLIDHHVSLLVGEERTRWVVQHRRRAEGLASISGLLSINVTVGQISVREIHSLRTICRYPLAIVPQNIGRNRIDLPSLIGCCTAGTSIVRTRHGDRAGPKAGNIKVAAI